MSLHKRFNLSSLAINNQTLTFYFFVVLLVAGIFAYTDLGQDEDPPFAFRAAVVQVLWPGADAMQISEQVTDQVERVLQEVPYYRRVRSYTKPGESFSIIELQEFTPPEQVDAIWYQMRKKLQDKAYLLPDDIQGPFVNDEFGDVFGIIYALSADGFSWAELEDYADEVRQSLLRIPDVSKVEFYGRQTAKLYVEISQQRLSQLGISIEQLVQQLNMQNKIADAGTLHTGLEDIQIRVTGQLGAVEELAQLPLRFGDKNLRLGDIATISRGYSDPPDPKVRFNQDDVVAIGVSMMKGGDIIDFGKAMDQAIDRIRASLPVGIEIHQLHNQPEVVQASVGEFVKVLMEALIIVLGVSFISLGLHTKPWRVDIRPGLVVALSIPTVLAITFLIMREWGIDLHKVSLGALIIALGLMVDDAIIIIEMTVRKLEEGLDKFKASIFAYQSTALPMLTGTLITAAGFMPIGFANSTTGEYAFALFGVTTAALLVSWLVSVYFVPWLGFHLLREKYKGGSTHHDVFNTPFYNKVRDMVGWCITHKKTTIFATIGAFLISIAGLQLVEQQYFPESSRDEILIDLWMPEGTSFASMEAVTHRFEQRLAELPGSDTITTFVGQGAPRFYLSLDQIFPQNNVSQIVLDPVNHAARERLRAQLPKLIEQEFPEVRGRARLLPMGPPVPYPVQFRVTGPDSQKVRTIADQVGQIIAADPDVIGLNDNWNEPIKAMVLDVDQARARALGISTQTVANAGKTLLDGIPIGLYREDNRQLPIVLRQPLNERDSVSAVSDAYMPNATGQSIAVRQVAQSSLKWEPGIIWREDRDYAITLQSDVTEDIQGSTVALRLEQALEPLRQSLDSGYDIKIGGTIEQSRMGQDSINAWIPAMLFIMFTLLVLQLRSVSRSILVFLTGPLGIIGAVLALLILDRPLGFVAGLGIIAMNGMIIRNSVILVDQIEQDIAAGVDRWNAVIEAAVRRFRPIMLTAATAVLAMIPLSRSDFWGPMASAMMGGLIIATVLTLLSLPAMYVAWFNVKKGEPPTTSPTPE